jgi:hypothetical protein
MKKLLFLPILLFISSVVFSQTGTLRGKITDAETGEELIGAAVLVEGTFQGSSADLDGNYSFNWKDKHQVHIYFV